MAMRAIENRSHDVEVLVVGAGLGGIAAALQLCAAGRSVILTEPLSMIGGQVTTQLTAPLDEHPLIETHETSVGYLRFRNLVRAQYLGVKNPGAGWVSNLCFEPLVGLAVLQDMLRPWVEAGLLRVLLETRPQHVHHSGEQGIQSIGFTDPFGELVISARQIIDATELGDLLPLSGAPWVIGSEGRRAHAESFALPVPDPLAEQACTVVAALVREDNAAPLGPPPRNYEMWRDTQPFSLNLSGHDESVHRYRMFETGPDGRESFWSYRRVRAIGPEAAVINWAGNDYDRCGLVAGGDYTVAQARELTLAFVHWLRTEVPRDDGVGVGYPELRLAPEVSGTPDGLAMAPYVRESRRLRTSSPVTIHDISLNGADPHARRVDDSVGIAWYHADLHARIGSRFSVYAPTAPFYIPASALVGPEVPNLIMGAKNLSATQIAAAAYRVHHGEWAVGEAAAHIALQALETARTAFDVVSSPNAVAEVQTRLVAAGCPIDWRPISAPGRASEVDTTAEDWVPGKVEILDQLRGSLVVSCQAQPHEELHGSEHMVAMARAVVSGGAKAVRAEGPEDIAAIRLVSDFPLIGLWKIGEDGVYITPTIESALRIVDCGADIVAFDATDRRRPDGSTVKEMVSAIHGRGALAMADVSTVAEGRAAQQAGADLVSTTLSGYTSYSPQHTEPDLILVRDLVAVLDVPVVAEGRIGTPAAAVEALKLGAHAVVVGGAITRPTQITRTFVDALGVANLTFDAPVHRAPELSAPEERK